MARRTAMDSSVAERNVAWQTNRRASPAKRLIVALVGQEAASKAKRVAKAVIGKDHLYPVQLDCHKSRFGDATYGWWMICPDDLTADSVVYSFGIGTDISFDRAIIERTGATVHAFDPNPHALAWVKRQETPPGFVLHPYGVADFDGIAPLFPPDDAVPDSFTMLDHMFETESTGPAPVYRLTTIMDSLGHTGIDLLKIDIEGMEYRVIRDLLADDVPVRQIVVEFHHRLSGLGFAKTRTAIRALQAHGFKIFHVSVNGWEYSFRRA